MTEEDLKVHRLAEDLAEEQRALRVLDPSAAGEAAHGTLR